MLKQLKRLASAESIGAKKNPQFVGTHPSKAPQKAYTSTQLQNGIRVATVEDQHSPVSTVSVSLNCGPMYQQGVKQVGFAQWLKFQAFKSTNTRSTIRITKEADLLGQHLSAHLDRSQLTLSIDCQRDDIPDSVQLLTDVLHGLVERDTAQWGIYDREFVRKSAEWKDSIHQLIEETKYVNSSPEQFNKVVMDELFRVAYSGTGLGMPLYAEVQDVDVPAVLNEYVPRVLSNKSCHFTGIGASAKDFNSASSLKLPSGSAVSTQSKFVGGSSFSTKVVPDDTVHYALAFESPALNKGQEYLSALVLKNLFGNIHYEPVKYFNEGSQLLNQAQVPHVDQLYSFLEAYPEGGLFGFYIRGEDSASVKECVGKVVSLLKSGSSKSLVNGDLITKAKLQTKAQLAFALEGHADKGEKLRLYNQILAMNGGSKLKSVSELLADVDAVTAESVKKVLDGMLSSKKPVVVAFGDAYGGLPDVKSLGLQ
ncbi:hypothetical protein MP228_008044 [Amoeboaphelidium protococcarum]|nr:hypothetical protein MP228_008044 [Amoeboaphelidium protococcarum]